MSGSCSPGAYGLGPLSSVSLGSTSQDVIRNAPCPVWMVSEYGCPSRAGSRAGYRPAATRAALDRRGRLREADFHAAGLVVQGRRPISIWESPPTREDRDGAELEWQPGNNPVAGRRHGRRRRFPERRGSAPDAPMAGHQRGPRAARRDRGDRRPSGRVGHDRDLHRVDAGVRGCGDGHPRLGAALAAEWVRAEGVRRAAYARRGQGFASCCSR